MRMRQVVRYSSLLVGLGLLLSTAALAAQVPFEQAVSELSSTSGGKRLRAAQLLKEAAYPEAAVPLAKAILDPEDDVQLEAIAAEVNIFLAEKVVVRKRVGFLIEVRNPISAESAFSTGPLALGPLPVPGEVLTALRAASRDDNPRVGLEALYAFGALGIEPGGATRRELLRVAGPDLAAMLGVPNPQMRYAALRVIGRLFEWRVNDAPIEQTVGDAVISALNDKDRVFRMAAMQALGAMRYNRGVQALTDLFTYFGKGDLAEASLDAIARIGHPSSAALLTSQLSSKSLALKMIAIEGLARVGDPGNAAAIDAALKSERNDALQLAGSFASAALAKGSIAPIVEAIQKPRIHEQARAYLAELASWRSADFSSYLTDPDWHARADLVDALGLGHNPAALPLVEPLLKDQDPQVARAAERTVARLRNDPRTS
jgi:HEAT repeat protein